MSLHIAITGATGFIGSNLIDKLRRANYSIRALTRTPKKHTYQGVTWITGTLQDTDALTELCTNVDAVIHCAAVVRGNSLDYFRTTNVRGTQLLLQVLKQTGFCGKFLLLSSLAARYPDYSWYARSKKEAETLAIDSGLPFTVTVFRPTAVYGPGDREMQPLFQLMKRGWLVVPSNEQIRISLLHVDDLVTAIEHWLNISNVCGVFELDDGAPNGFTWQDLVAIGETTWKRRIRKVLVPIAMLRLFAWVNLFLARILGYQAMLSPGKVNEISHRNWVCNDANILQQLDWIPEQKLADRINDAAIKYSLTRNLK